MAETLAAVAKAKGIKYFLISYVDLFGGTRAKLVPAAAITTMQKNGAGFAGFATHLDMTPADADTLAIPDAGSVIQLPWKRDVAWVPGDLVMSGKSVEQTPRTVLKNQIERAAKLGLRMKTGVECEFILLAPDQHAISDTADTAAKPCYDQLALMRRSDLIAEICDAMLELGWNPYQNDHEDANGQFEINWEYDDCLLTADRHVFFKFMVKSIAEKHGMRATFMPKPFIALTGSGCHAHVSVWDAKGRNNLFHDEKGELGLSALAYQFLGGVVHHAPALTALFNPTVNSYKRINAPVTTSGATWAPNTISYSGNNRTHMIRIPEPGRFELRLADGAANPYLLQAGLLAAGLDGITEKRDPGKRLDINMYTEGHALKNVKRLPLNLLDSLRSFEKDTSLQAALGAPFSTAYLKLRHADWNSYARHLTQWELDTTLDC